MKQKAGSEEPRSSPMGRGECTFRESSMGIRKSGKWSKGTAAADLDDFLRTTKAIDYPADRFIHPACACGHVTFRLIVDEDCAQRVCAACGTESFVCDSGDYWDDAEPGECACPCGGEIFDLAVGFSHVDAVSSEGESFRTIKWVTVAARCIKCGILGVYADWKIDYEPCDHLYRQA
jgi:hypothetical protein